MMDDILKKLTQIEASAPKAPAKKKKLTEDTSKRELAKKPTLKDVFNALSENIAPGATPLPVMDPTNKKAGMGFVTSTNPSIQNILKSLDPKDVQIVQAPGQPGQALAPSATIKPTGTVGATQGGHGQAMGAGQQAVQEKDEGKPGKNFAKIAKSAGKRYGSKEAGERVAGAVRAKLAKQGKLEEEQLDELSQEKIHSYIDKAVDSKAQASNDIGAHRGAMAGRTGRYIPGDNSPAAKQKAAAGQVTYDKRNRGIDMAINNLVKKVPANEGEKVDRMVKHIEKSERKLGKSKDTASDIAWATANKRGMLDNKNKKVKEADIPSSAGIDNKGAGLGAGRSPTTLEGKTMNKKAKPDFLDMDKDGNKKEPMKKAVADKKKKAVKEGVNGRIAAARHEGRADGLRGNLNRFKQYDELEEARAYHDGYKDGLDECYGQGVYEGLAGTAGGAIAGGMLGGPLGAVAGGMLGSEISKESAPAMPAATVGGMANAAMEDEFDEGNAFTGALARTPKGGKFSVGGKTFTDRSSIDEYAFESWNKQLKALVNESEVNEGMTVSISKGQQGAPDSVSISAQDAEAEHLLAFVKNAGLGIFGDDAEAHTSSAMSIQPVDGGEPEANIDVVDGSDGMLSLMKKLGGISGSEGSEDYADEEHGEEEHTCNECGMMEAQCGCSHDKEQVEEVESEDQMEFEVAEANAPDTGADNTNADVAGQVGADNALAKADAGQDLEDGMSDQAVQESDDEEDEEVAESFSFESFYKKLAMLESTESEDEKAEKAGKKVAKDIEHDEGHKGKDDDKAEKAGKKVTKDIEYDDKKDKKEKVDEWANNAGPGKTVSDTTFEQDIDFMTKVIAGGLNKPKSTGQTTIPVIAGQDDRTHDNPKDWATLAGIKKS